MSKIINKIASKVTGNCLKEVSNDSDEFLITAYGMECIISDIIQVILLIVLGLIFGILPEITMFSVCFTTLKKRIGGYHASSHLACISSYTIISVTVTLLVKNLLVEAFLPLSIALYVLAVVLIFFKSPLPHKNMPRSLEITKKQWNIARISTVILSFILVILYFIFPSVSLAGCYGVICCVISRLIPNREEG